MLKQGAKKIAVIGATDTILPFKAIGAIGFEAEDAKMAEDQLDDLVLQGYGVIYIEEAYARTMADKLTKLNMVHRDMSITVIPGSKGGSDFASENTRQLVKKAIGIDILADKKGKIS